MDQLQLRVFLNKLSSGDYTNEEYKAFADWLENTSREEYEMLLQTWQEVVEEKESFEPLPANLIKNIEAGLDSLDEQNDNVKPLYPETARSQPLWKKFAAAASIVVAVSVTGYFVLHKAKPAGQVAQVSHDVLPGKHTATLTLANGQKIVLSQARNGQIAIQAGSAITKTADGQLIYDQQKKNSEVAYNILSTAMAETYQVTLPDGSKAWLNANSSLKYPAAFIGKERLVELTGEAYFEVVHNSNQPFRVKSANQLVEDIGTHFNINAYNDEPAKETTLLEGAVKVNGQLLKPGQQAINDGNHIKIAAVNTEAITDWKDGDFNLDGLPFKVAMRKISRWYDIEVDYDANVPDDFQTVGWVSRNRKLSVVLKSIEGLGIVQFRIDGKKLYVSKKP